MKAFKYIIKTAFLTKLLLLCVFMGALAMLGHPLSAHAAINLSGTLYSDIGTTPITTAKTIKAIFGTSTPSIHTTTSDGSGNYSFSVATSSLGSWGAVSAAGDNDGWKSVAYGEGRFVAVGTTGEEHMSSTDGSSWTATAAGEGSDWLGITYGKGVFVAVAESGTDRVMTSQDGVTWATRSAAGNDDVWQSVAYGNGRFVAVADSTGATDAVMYSDDGINWTVATAVGDDDYWRSVTYGNGLFVAVGSGGGGDSVMSSTDGITWTTQTVAETNTWRSVTYGNGLFVAVASDGTNRVMTSPNGVNWTTQTAAENNTWRSVTYGNGLFVAAGSSGTNRVMYSSNGINWTAQSAVGNDDSWYSVVYGQGKFVTVGSGADYVMTADAGLGPDTPITLYVDGDSVDATTYMMGATSTNIANIPLYQSNVVVMNANTNAASSTTKLADMHRYSSSDDVDILFTATTTGTTTMQAPLYISQGTIEAPLYLELKGNFTNLGSFDHRYGTTTLIGTNQTLRTTATTTFYDLYQVATTSATTNFATTSVFATQGKLTLQGPSSDPLKLRSTNTGTQWTIYPTGQVSATYLDVKDSKNSSSTAITCSTGCLNAGNNTNWNFGANLFLSGTLYSDTGTTPITASKTIKAVVGTSTPSIHTASTQTDGTFTFGFATSSLGSWATSTVPGTLTPRGVAYGEGRFVAVGGNGSGNADIMTSEDGVTWTSRNAPYDDEWHWVVYGEGRFVAVGLGGGVIYSNDGITWSTALTNSDPKLDTAQGIAYGSGTFVAIEGDASADAVAYSYDGITWATSSNGFESGYQSISYGNGKFIATTWDWGSPLFYSTDGITWSNAGVSFPGGPSDCLTLFGVTYGNGRYVGMCYDNGNSTYTSVTSSDGLTWVGHNTAPEDNAWGVVHYANGYFVARSDGGTSRLMYSTDGIEWTMVNIGAFDDVWNTGITYGEGKFVSVNAAGTSKVFYADAGLGPDTPITLYVDGDSVDATTYLMGASSSNIANIPLYQSNVVVMNANGTAASSTTKLADMHRYSSSDDVDILFTATTTGTTTMQAPLYISQGTIEAPLYLELKGNFTNLGSFDHRYGTTTLIGTNQTLRTTATTTFYDLYQVATTSATTTFATTSVFATAGKLTLQGTTTSPLKLRSTNDGTQWTLYPLGEINVSYVDVKDSKNSSTTAILCDVGCVNSGNNTNWMFSVAGLNLSGILFDTVGSPITTGKTIKLVVGTSTQSIHSATSDGDGIFEFTLATSSIGSWSTSSPPEDNEWRGIGYGRGRFVAVSSSGTNKIMYSDDNGSTWTAAAAPYQTLWSAVTYGKGMFVSTSVGSVQSVMYSRNGANWSLGSAPEQNNWYSVTYGNGRFVAVSNDGTSRVMHSDDGINWTAASSTEANEWNSVTFGNGRFVAVAGTGANRVMYSSDGITWATASAAQANEWNAVTFGNGRFVAVAGTGTNRAMYSNDGISWTVSNSVDANDWFSVEYGNGYYVARSDTGTNRVMYSTDGISWTMVNIGGVAPDHNVYNDGIAFGGGKFVSVNHSGTNEKVWRADAGFGPDTPLTFFVDGDAVDATTFMMGATSTDIDIVTLYQNSVVVMNANSNAASSTTKLADMHRYSSADDVDVLFTASTTGTTTMLAMLSIDNGTVEAPHVLYANHGLINNRTFKSGSLGTDFISVEGSLSNESVITIDPGTELYVNGSFTNNGTFSQNGTLLYDGDLSVDDLTYTDSFSVAGQETTPTEVAFKIDGTKMYVLGATGEDVTEYNLATPWDVSSGSSVDTFSVSTQESIPTGMAFKPDGTKLYVVGADNDQVIEYNLATPWDVSSGSFVDTFSVAAQEAIPNAIAFNPEGTKMYVMGVSGDDVNEYNLGTAWDASTGSFVDSFDVSDEDGSPTALAFNGDGTKLFVLGSNSLAIYEYLLGTAWDVSTGQLVSSFSVASEEDTPEGLAVHVDGLKLYVAGDGDNAVFEYALPEPVWSGTFTGSSALGDFVVQAGGAELSIQSNASTSDLTLEQYARLNTLTTGLTISGNYQNLGTFDSASSTVYFDSDVPQTATGTMSTYSSFYNLIVANTSGDGTTTQSVAFGAPVETTGTFTMRASTSASFLANATSSFTGANWSGGATSPVYLRSSTPGTAWGFDTDTAVTASYVNVRDSYYSSTTADVSCLTGCTNVANNTNWYFGESVFMGSGAAQSFYVGQATTTLEDVTLIEPLASANVTAANDIRISIPTSTVNFRFDTTNTSLSYSGTASGKVGNPVTYENGGATVVIPVSSDFAAEDTLVIGGLEVGSFAAVSTATGNLELHLGGSVDGTPDATDTEVVGITGTLTLADHSNTQPASQFSSTDENDATLFAFELTPANENATVTALTIDLTAMNKINSSRVLDIKLYRDTDSDRVVDAGDVQVGGAGVLVNSGQSGTITFSTPFLASTSQEYIVSGDTLNIPTGARMTMTLNGSGLTTTGTTSSRSVAILGSAESATHSRLSPSGGGGGGAGGPIGGYVEGGGEQTGGGGGLGEGIGDDGETLTLGPGFFAPSSTGDPQNEWTNGGNVYESDGSYATAASGGLRQGYGTFAFSIPANNSIEGIVVKLEASGSTAAGDIGVALSWDGGSTFTSPKTTTTLTGSDAIYTLGSPSDEWGRSWSVSEFNNANFRLRIIANPSSNTVRIDAITVRPYHQVGGGGGGAGGAL